MAVELILKGVEGVAARISTLTRRVPEAAGNALVEETQIELVEAQRRTPVLTGALRASGHVEGPLQSGNSVQAWVKFGGPSVPYALYVHENLEAFHRVGQAKFLESVIREAAPYFASRVAARLQRELGL